MKKYVCYRRVSSEEQGESGLGLKAQTPIIRHFTKDGKIIAAFKEVKSAKNMERPKLKQAIALVKKENAILVVSKTDRLSRNVIDALSIIDEIGEENLLCCDLPQTDRLTLTIFFALAEHERFMISLRTKLALDAKKKRRLEGNDPNQPSGRKKGYKVTERSKEKFRKTMEAKRKKIDDLTMHLLKESIEQQLSLKQTADKLNKAGCKAPRGGPVKEAHVFRLKQRLDEQSKENP